MSGQLSIEAASATYVVPAAHPDPSGVRARLDVVGRRLPEVLPAPLDALAAGREREVWLVRCLAVGVDLDLGADDASLARTWANGLVAALAALLGASPADSADGDVIVFADDAAHVAAFVGDLVDGSAHDRWWHGRFAGLQPLPASAAIAAAITSEPPRGRRALGRLAQWGRLEPVLGVLGERGCARVLRALYPDSVAPAPSVAPLASTAPPASRSQAGAARRLRLAAERERAALGGSSAAPAAVAAPTGVPAAGRRRVGSRSPGLAGSWEREDLWTPFGGACLLLRAMVELGLAALDGPARLLALRAALGAERARATEADDPLALLAGVTAPAPEATGELGGLLVRGLVETGRTDGRAVCIEPTPLGLLVRDPSRDVWLAAGGADAVRGAIDVLADFRGDAPSIVTAPSPVDESEFAYWSLPDAPPAIALAGRALVRDLTSRLAGFERSTPGHVWRNLLDRGAWVNVGASIVRADLEPAPLDVVLLLAGFHGLRFEVPWLGEVELALPR